MLHTDIRKFVLSYYETATEDFFVTQITKPVDALKVHYHDYFQLYYILQGEILHHVGDSTAMLASGDVFIIPPETPHFIEHRKDSVNFYAISFMPGYFSGVGETNRLVADFLHYLTGAAKNNILPKLILPEGDVLFVETVFRRIMDEFNGSSTGKEEVIRSCVSVLLSIFARIYFEQKAQSLDMQYNRSLVMHCIEYIKNHSDEDISLSEITRRTTMSKTCFCSIFTSITGKSFKRYLNECRIEKAAKLIQAGERITAVSQACGYEYFSTFYRNFVKIMGISPEKYRQSALAESEDISAQK